MISKSSLEALKSRIDIVDVVDHYIELKKVGANYKTCCPFHSENTPSFVVSPQKQIYNCFGGCGSGDAIKFVMKLKQLEFTEAVEEIAGMMNFRLEYEKGSQNPSKSFDILEKMQRYFVQNLSEEQIAYLKTRGVNQSAIDRFGIGYAPGTKPQVQYLTQNRIPLEEAEKVGILAVEKEKRYARFTHRITFPIKNTSGKIVGFSGRITGGDRAKYLNTPETKLFDKSSLLYGYDLARDDIHGKGTILILEGQLDVVLCHQIGIKTAVATLGTALTDKHIALIKKHKVKVLLAYDGDAAGLKAAYRAAEMLSRAGIDGGVVIFADGDDPAEMISTDRKEALIAKLKKPIKLVKFVLMQIARGFVLTDAHGKNEALKACILYLQNLDSIIAESHRGVVAQILDVDIAFVSHGAKSKNIPIVHKQKNVAEISIIKSILEDSRLGDIAVDILDDDAMQMQHEYRQALSGEHDGLAEIALDDLPAYDAKTFTKAVVLHQREYLQRKQKEVAPTATIMEIRSFGAQIQQLTNILRREDA